MGTDQKYSADLELYLYLHPSYFTYAIYKRSNNTFIECKFDIHDGRKLINNIQLADWLKKHQLVFSKNYEDIKVCVNATAFSLLNDKSLATASNFKVLNEYNAASDVLLCDEFNDLFVQYTLKNSLYKILTGYFEKSQIRFGDSGLISAIKHQSNHSDFVSCQLLGEEATILVCKEDKLILFNKYLVKSNEDLLYYILLSYQANDLDTSKVQLFMSGLIEKESPRFKLIYDYIKNIELSTSYSEMNFALEILDDANHYFFNLLNIRLCES